MILKLNDHPGQIGYFYHLHLLHEEYEALFAWLKENLGYPTKAVGHLQTGWLPVNPDRKYSIMSKRKTLVIWNQKDAALFTLYFEIT